MLHNTGQTFRAYLADGFEGERATLADWESHLNTLFPEVRLKKTIEVRGADSQDTSLVCALPALWKGLLYEPTAFDRAEALVERLTFAEVEAVRPAVAERALRAVLAGRTVGEWASELFEIAWDGLASLSHLNRDGEDETVHLARLRRLVSRGESPADALLADIDPAADLRGEVLRKAQVDSRNGSTLKHS